MKKMPAETLFQSFVRKVGDKVERYFSGLEDGVREEDGLGVFDWQRVRAEMRGELEGVGEVLGRKLGGKGRGVERGREEEIVSSLYTVIEYYQWTKSDVTAISSKFRLDPSIVLRDVKSKSSPSDPWGLVSL